jgi:oligopeptidase B
MRGRIKEDDSSVPSPDGAWLYGVRYVTGGEQPKYFRIPRGGGDEQVTLDGDLRRKARIISASPAPVSHPITGR